MHHHGLLTEMRSSQSSCAEYAYAAHCSSQGSQAAHRRRWLLQPGKIIAEGYHMQV